ncbi:MAG: twitching motility protein PilT, partial [bacterium]
MFEVIFQLQGDLGDLVPARQRGQFRRQLPAPASAKDTVEALGIPHTEVDLLLADGRPLDFSFLVDREL